MKVVDGLTIKARFLNLLHSVVLEKSADMNNKAREWYSIPQWSATFFRPGDRLWSEKLYTNKPSAIKLIFCIIAQMGNLRYLGSMHAKLADSTSRTARIFFRTWTASIVGIWWKSIRSCSNLIVGVFANIYSTYHVETRFQSITSECARRPVAKSSHSATCGCQPLCYFI